MSLIQLNLFSSSFKIHGIVLSVLSAMPSIPAHHTGEPQAAPAGLSVPILRPHIALHAAVRMLF